MDTNMPEGQWPEHAKRLLQEMAVREPDQSMIDQIIGCLALPNGRLVIR
ncbi:hypothetical protein [Mesorhizobium sp. WSM3224]|nr:hypothetical protein [Mesorhizobium sp. WSM3224]